MLFRFRGQMCDLLLNEEPLFFRSGMVLHIKNVMCNQCSKNCGWQVTCFQHQLLFDHNQTFLRKLAVFIFKPHNRRLIVALVDSL